MAHNYSRNMSLKKTMQETYLNKITEWDVFGRILVISIIAISIHLSFLEIMKASNFHTISTECNTHNNNEMKYERV